MSAAFTDDPDARVWGTKRRRRHVPARLLRLASDERLVEHVRSGSEPAFEALFDRHHRGVLGFCRHMLGSVEEAEDAVQHTFLAAYRELQGTDKPIQLRPWLYTIARNRCITVLRARRHQAAAELSEPPTEHLASEVERRHDLQDLLRDVARLPDDQREALVLSELGDMSHDEIAAVLDCRREKVKALVFQARTSLIASRAARDMPCAEIREQLANLRGGSLRRVEIKRHVRECAGCREFGEQVRAQRRDLAIVLPVAPTVGLKAALFGGTGAGAGVAGSAMSGGSVATKLLVAAAIAGGGTVAVEQTVSKPPPAPPREAAPPQDAGAVSAHEAHSAKSVTTTSRRRATLAAPVRAGTTPVARRKAAKPHARHGASKMAPGHVQKAEATPWTPPGQADKPAPHGTKPYTPPGQANKPDTPPGQANKPAAQSNKPVTPPGELKRTTTPAQLKKTAAAPVTAVAPEPVKPVKTPKADKAEPADDAQG